MLAKAFHSPKTSKLQHKPLPNLRLLIQIFTSKLALFIVSFDEVQQDRAGFPDDFVVVRVVNDGGDTAVRVDLEESGVLDAVWRANRRGKRRARYLAKSPHQRALLAVMSEQLTGTIAEFLSAVYRATKSTMAAGSATGHMHPSQTGNKLPEPYARNGQERNQADHQAPNVKHRQPRSPAHFTLESTLSKQALHTTPYNPYNS